MGNFKEQFFLTPEKPFDPQGNVEWEISLVLLRNRFHSFVVSITMNKLL